MGLLSECSLIFQQGVRGNLVLICSLRLCSKRNSCMLIFHRASVSMKLARMWFTVYWLQIWNLCILLMELIKKKKWVSPGFNFLSYFLPTTPWQRFISRQEEKSGVWTAVVLISLRGHWSVCLSFSNKKRADWSWTHDSEWMLFGKLLVFHKL